MYNFTPQTFSGFRIDILNRTFDVEIIAPCSEYFIR